MVIGAGLALVGITSNLKNILKCSAADTTLAATVNEIEA